MTTETEGAADAVPSEQPAPEVQDADLAPEAQAEGDEAEADAAPPTDEQAPKPKKSAKERIDELTAARREAEREAEYWRSKALQPTQQQPTTPAPQAAPEEDKEPDPADYTHGDLDAAFIRDHATFAARRAFREEMQKERAERAQVEAQTAWQAKEAAAIEKYPDYREKLGDGRSWPCTDDMAAAIRESDVGADLAYHLASNPAEARRIAAMTTPYSRVREIGKLEAKLSAPPAPQPKLASSAPEPPPVLRGQGGRFEAAADTDDFTAFQRLAEKVTGA